MSTFKQKFNKKHKHPLNKANTLAEISKLSGITKASLQAIYNRGIGAYKTNPESVRVKGTFKKNPKAPLSRKLSKEQWAMASVYASISPGSKANKIDKDLIKYKKGRK